MSAHLLHIPKLGEKKQPQKPMKKWKRKPIDFTKNKQAWSFSYRHLQIAFDFFLNIVMFMKFNKT